MRRAVESREARAQRNARWPHRSRMGHSRRSPGKLGTPGRGLKAKAPSLWKDGNKGTQRTRKLSTGGLLWSWRNGHRRFMVSLWRSTKGVKPDALKGASPVLNGGDEETGLCRPRLVATQLECEKFNSSPRIPALS